MDWSLVVEIGFAPRIPKRSALKIVQIKKTLKLIWRFFHFKLLIRDRGGIQTPNPQSRNLIFYSVELRGQYSHATIQLI